MNRGGKNESDDSWVLKGDEGLIQDMLWNELIEEYHYVLCMAEKLLPQEVQDARKESGLTDVELDDIYHMNGDL